MRRWSVLLSSALLFSPGTFVATGQPKPAPAGSADSRKTPDPARRDGEITDPEILDYVRRINKSIAAAANVPAPLLRVTRSGNLYVLPHAKSLSVSRGLLQRIENEAELAGVLAHELAHYTGVPPDALQSVACVLISKAGVSQSEETRERERRATAAALAYTKAAGYDPASVLDLFSKLAYEHPAWAKAITPADLLQLRTQLEEEAMPPAGYRLQSSEFSRMHARLASAPGERQ